MKRGPLVAAATLATFAVGLAFSIWSGGWTSEEAQEPILVVLVGGQDAVATVRSVISNERVVSDAPDAFVLVEERIIAANLDAASVPINEMGWTHRRIELVGVVMDSGRNWERERVRRAGPSGGQAEDPAGAEKIAQLMSKPSLSAFEAAAVLRHMDATGQF